MVRSAAQVGFRPMSTVDKGWSGYTPLGPSGGGSPGYGYPVLVAFSASQGQTIFTLGSPVAAGMHSAIVVVNGLVRDPFSDYSCIGADLTFAFGLSTGARVLVYYVPAVPA